MSELHRAAARLLPGVLLLVAVGSGCATISPATGRTADPDADLVARWNRIAPAELDRVWSEAQETAGLIAAEPLSHVTGAQAARKKSWGFADGLFKLFAGSAPIWFPADLVRHTVCGDTARWSYFWWFASGPERDLHPWVGHEQGFEDLVGPHGDAIVASGVLDLSDCAEVGGPAGQACLYGEVTPPDRFEEWFCGRRGAACRARLTRDATDVPPGFSRPDQLCFEGPWVVERVHGWRPEIHPAEVVWSRPKRAEPSWRVALLPDDSERFDAAKHYAALGSRAAEAWSRRRPVELWIAFSFDPDQGIAFDLAVDDLRETPRLTHELTPPPAGGPFVRLPSPRADLLVAARTWAVAGEARSRGMLVLRTAVRPEKDEPRLLGITGRGPHAPRTEWPFPRRAEPRAAAAAAPAPEPAPSVRLLPFNRVRSEVPGRWEVHTMARFDPRRPSMPDDERRADRLNESLAGGASRRRSEFGKDRPFILHVTLEAFGGDCARVPVVVGDSSAPPGTVVVAPQRGEATEAVVVEGPGAPRERETFADVVTLGELALRVPPGVTVTGRVDVQYTGRGVGLAAPAVSVGFRVPPPRAADEWELLGNVLADLDRGTAESRLAGLQADACSPLAAPCTLDAYGAEVARRFEEPTTRWSTRRDTGAPDRAFARFLRMMAVAFRWDGEVEYDEYARLWRLLSARYEPGRRLAAAAPEPRCR